MTRHRWPDRISLHQGAVLEDGTTELSLCSYKGAAYLQPENLLQCYFKDLFSQDS